MTLPPSMVEEVVQKETPLTKPASGVAEASSPGPTSTWTPKQFFEFVEGFVGEFECSQIKDMMQERGLVIVPREPTDAMLFYMSSIAMFDSNGTRNDNERAAYKAMIAVARPGEDASATPTDCLVPSSLNQSNFSKHTG